MNNAFINCEFFFILKYDSTGTSCKDKALQIKLRHNAEKGKKCTPTRVLFYRR